MKVKITTLGILICGFYLLCLSHASACDMMGVSFNKEVDLNNLFSRFRTISEKKDADGWGVAFYGDASATVFKEPIRAAESELAKFLITNKSLKSKILIAHLREASIGRPSPRNTHPWTRELGGKGYAFAHVGGADKRLLWQTVKLGRFIPLGENCAEFLFCHILAKIEEYRIETWNEQSFARLHQVLVAVNEVQDTCHLLSDGTHLFAYSGKQGKRFLSYVKREMTPTSAGTEHETTKPESAVGIVVARNGHNLAEPGEQWTKIEPGQLVVFKDGQLVYASKVVR
jgi:glutamine amidotransferase